MSTMMALTGSLGSTSPMIWPLMRSYCPTLPKLLPPKAGDSVLVITTWVTRACAGTAHSMTPVSERQHAMAATEYADVFMQTLPGSNCSPIIPAAVAGWNGIRLGTGPVMGYAGDLVG